MTSPGARVLARILENKRDEIRRLAATPTPAPGRECLDVVAALRRGSGPLRLIAEVKRRSPSAGALSTTLSPGARAVAYAEAGAAMVSVLCDGPSFDGAWEHVTEARDALDARGHRIPVLAKEFVLDARQVGEARHRGADAVLLIARIVDGPTLVALVERARREGLEPLVEVTHEAELAEALEAGARVIGVNARDLDDLTMDAERAQRVLSRIPEGAIAVYLSGIGGAADVRRVGAGRADAALLGEALMRQDDPRALLRDLVAAT